jgi:choline dehydrogenase-like flavoprotein
MNATDRAYDVIVVGAGTAGAPLAARLSENDARQVLLLEAGPDYGTIDEFPGEIQRARSLAAAFPGHPLSWNFTGRLTDERDPYPLARGKIVGGSSSVNGTYFIRGRPQDFDVWGSVSNGVWSYESVLPYFRKGENDHNFVNEYHGQDGPIGVLRPRPDQLRPVSEAFVQSCLDAGYPDDPDKNAPGQEGIGPVPRNCLNGIRQNTAACYLGGVRDRKNLTVLGETLVRRVLFEGNRAVGVEAERDGQTVTYRGAEVVLCASGFKSPHLLLLSGIGPAAHLREYGIEVVHDSPGVGQNVKDHPSVHIAFQVKDDGVPLPDDFMTFQTTLNHTSPSGGEVSDIQITCGAASFNQMLRAVPAGAGKRAGLPSYMKRPLATFNALRKLPARLVLHEARMQDNIVLLCSLDASKSNGRVFLRTADPREQPGIDLNYLTDPADLPRVVYNLRTCLGLLRSPGFSRLGLKVASPTPDESADDEALGRWARNNMATSLHTHNSVHMGPSSDPMAVVDEECRVYGVEGLRVVDISIIPEIRRGPAATAVMIGERAAAFFDRPAAAPEAAAAATASAGGAA